MDREKVIRGYECCLRIAGGCKDCPYWDQTTSNKCERKLKEDAIALLKEQEAVVRCKDCKYGEPWGVLIGCGTSKGFGITHNPDWFCADGERKEGR